MYKLEAFYHYQWHTRTYSKKEDAVSDAIIYRHTTGYTARVKSGEGAIIHESKGKEDGGTARRIPVTDRGR